MERLFFCVLKMSTISLYCIGMVLLVRLLLKRAPKIYSYLLWIIVFIRLICPVVLESPVSLVPGAFMEMGEILYGGTEEEPDGQEGKQEFEVPGWENENEETSLDYNPQKKADNMAVKKDGGKDAAIQSGKQEVLIKTGARIWFLGMVLSLVYFTGAVIGMKEKLAGAKKLPEAFYERKKGDCKRIYVSEGIKTAFVFGIFKPGIYLPAGMEKQEMEYVIRHEQIHVRRWDYRIKMAAFVIVCIHWFNPFVWLSYLLMEKDMEMSCDERVLKEMGEEIKKAYSGSLLSMAIYEKGVGRIPIAFGEKDVKNRIQNVLSYKKAKAGITIFGILLCVTTAAGLLTNHKGKNENDTGILAGQEKENEKQNEKQKEKQKEAYLKKWAETLDSVHKDNQEFNQYNKQTKGTKKLTMEEVRELPNKREVTLQDFEAYSNGIYETFSDENALNGYLNFALSYEGESYELNISYMLEDNTIDSIGLVRTETGEMILLRAMPKYEQNPDVEGFLHNHTKVSDYVQYQLPEGLSESGFLAGIGSRGGHIFYYENEEITKSTFAMEWGAPGGIMFLDQNQAVFHQGKLAGAELEYNHTEYLPDTEEYLEGCETQAFLFLANHDLYTASEVAEAEENGNPIREEDQTANVWYVCFARENGKRAYALFLNDTYFDKEDIVSMARNIRFKEGAFD